MCVCAQVQLAPQSAWGRTELYPNPLLLAAFQLPPPSDGITHSIFSAGTLGVMSTERANR